MADEPRAPETGEAGASQKPKKAGSFAWLWMILALISVGGFLAWLGMEAEPTSVTVVETEDEGLMDPPSIPVISKDSLADNKAEFVAQDIRVHNVAITGTLGDRIYWGELGDRNTQVPILLRLDSASAAGFVAQTGTPYSVRGRTYPMNDSIANAWGDDGEFSSEGNQMQAMFTDYYMELTDIRPTPARLRASTPSSPAQDSAAGAGMDGEGGSDGSAAGAAGASG